MNPFFSACLNLAIFTANFTIPLRNHVSFDMSEVDSSIYGLCGVELMPLRVQMKYDSALTCETRIVPS